MRISYTMADTYRRCPQLYKLRYLDRIRPEPPPPVILGGHVHEALKQLHQPSLPAFPSLEQLIEWFQESWEKNPISADEGMDWYQRGVALLSGYHQVAREQQFPAGAVERIFSIPFDHGHQIVGRIDRIDMPAPDTVEVVDYKTGRVPTQQEVDENLQLAVYHMAARHMYPDRKIRTTLYFLVTNFPMSAEFDDDAIERHKAELRRVIAGIEAEAFEVRASGWCDYCECRDYCDLFRRPEQAGELELDEARLGQLGREYLDAEAAQKEAKQRIERVRQIFASYLDQTGRPGFTAGDVHVRRTAIPGRVSFDAPGVLEALEPAGMADRVLEVSDRLVRALLKESDLPGDLRRALEECGTHGKESARWSVKSLAPGGEDEEEET